MDVDKWQQSDRAGNVTKVLVRPWPASLSPMHGRTLPKNLTGGSLRVCVCVCAEEQDQGIGKHAYVIKGKISASNYLAIPRCVLLLLAAGTSTQQTNC